jgi:predicted ATPase/DNA-binding SARP family transcriptional activator/DNA-binding CsgD family transcriptional regulator
MGLRIQLLGTFRVTVDDRVVEPDAWRRRKAQSLIKLLALAPDLRLHREQAIEALWPRLAPAAGLNNLHRVLHVARRALTPAPGALCPYLRLQGERLALCPDSPLWIDVLAFEAAAAAARRTREVEAYRAALALYTGDLLPEDRYEDWASDRRDRLRTEHLGLLRELARLYSARGEGALAGAVLRQVVALEPTDETAQMTLARLYVRVGQRAQAIRQYRQLEAVLRRELGVAPSPASQRFYQELVGDEGQGSSAAAPGHTGADATVTTEIRHPSSNLPHMLSSFVGRRRAVETVRRLLGRARLVTLTGPGGIGKTRLAVAVAAVAQPRYPDGVWWVELAALTDPRLLPQEVARALDVQSEAARPIESTLADFLRSRRALLLLDNCEHLLEACAALVNRLLQAAPALHVLATSRQPLGVVGEQAWPVLPLALPPARATPPLDELRSTAAVQLFVERASSVQPSFALAEDNAAAVTRICQRLDGLPLAIELAAACTTTLTAAQIAARLDDRFRLLRNGSRTALPRHQTLQAALDWSYALLAEGERVLLQRVAVFAGGFTLEAAEIVCASDALPQEMVLPLLTRLVDKSLLIADTRGARARYRLLETIREYALLQLATHDDPAHWRTRHAAWCLALAEEAEPALFGPQQLGWLDQLDQENDNLRAALGWYRSDGDAEDGRRLAAALWWFWQVRGHVHEGSDWLEALLARDSGAATPARAKALVGAGVLLWRRGETVRAVALETESLALARRLGDPQATALALHYLGIYSYERGDREQAAVLLTEAVALWRAAGPPWRLAASLARLAVVVDESGDSSRAAELLDEALALHQQLGHQWGLARTWLHRGKLAREAGNPAHATTALQESLALFRALGDQWGVVYALVELGELAWASGDLARASELLDEALAPEHQVAYRWGRARALRLQAALARQHGDDANAARLLEESLACCLELGDRPGAAAARGALAALATDHAQGWEQLTRREREVTTLLARGLTDRQIAAALHLALRTAETHVWHSMRKLGCTSRTQVAALVRSLQHASTSHGD